MTTFVDEVTKRASGKISVLLGAGASAAAGLPTMVSFLRNAYGAAFLDDLSKCDGYAIGTQNTGERERNALVMLKRMFHTAGLKQKKLSYDLEDVFEFIHQSRVLHTSTDIVKALFWMFKVCAEGPNWNFDVYAGQMQNYSGQLASWLSDFESAVADLRKHMYDAFLIDGDEIQCLDKAQAMYQILPGIFGDDSPVVFTTNFDTVFDALEYTDRLRVEVLDGIGGKRKGPPFDLGNFSKPGSPKEQMLLFKLHGSVTWERTSTGIRDCFPQIPKTVALLEPVISKRPAESPFTEMYQIFRNVLHANESCVAIGFSFRDDTIREIVRERLDGSPPFHLIIVAPDDKSFPDLNRHLIDLSGHQGVTWVREPFGTTATEEKIRAAIRKGPEPRYNSDPQRLYRPT